MIFTLRVFAGCQYCCRPWANLYALKDLLLAKSYAPHIDSPLQAERLEIELANLRSEISQLEYLLRHADPDGYFREGTRAAATARQKGLRLYNKAKDEEAMDRKAKQERNVMHGTLVVHRLPTPNACTQQL